MPASSPPQSPPSERGGGRTPSPPLVLIVTGPPCTGKTTLARRLATSFALPLMTKDWIKETLFETLGADCRQSASDRAWSRRLGGASMELLYLYVESQLAAGQSCVVEGNFDTAFATPAFRRMAARYLFLPIQVNCVADPAVLAARFRERARSGERHPGHQDHLPPDPRLDAPTDVLHLLPGRLEPLDIGGHAVELDMSDFAHLDYDDLCAKIRQLWTGK
jgi:predicted kinase